MMTFPPTKVMGLWVRHVPNPHSPSTTTGLGGIKPLRTPSRSIASGLRVVIYPNDHRPEHVRVIGAGAEAVFELRCPVAPVTLRESYGFTTRQLRRLIDKLTAVLPMLCNAWREIHDPE